MPSVQSRPIIESDGNNVALRRSIRMIKRIVGKVTDIIVEGGLVTEDLLDALGSAVVQLMGLVGYPFTYFLSMPEIFKVFAGKPLPMTLPLIFVLHIILLIYSTYVLCYLPAVGISPLSAESISFHIITGLAIVSYYRGVATDPGRIPTSSEWEKENAEKKTEGLRFCSREKKWKPERTHFCSAIGHNVLKMDHYCPWLANCVGYFNHKFFMLFIVYASIASGWTTISVAQLLAMSSAGYLAKSQALSAAQIFFLSEGLCISSLISLILTPFAGFHVWLVARNQTTLEYCEKANANTSYDFGIFFNFAQVFGYNPLFWLLPVQTAPSDGLRFNKRILASTATDSEDEEETKVRSEMEAKLGLTHLTEAQETCCVRKWDTDSPLIDHKQEPSWWNSFVGKCLEVNAFREKCQSGFSNIVSGSSSPRLTPASPTPATPPV